MGWGWGLGLDSSIQSCMDTYLRALMGTVLRDLGARTRTPFVSSDHAAILTAKSTASRTIACRALRIASSVMESKTDPETGCGIGRADKACRVSRHQDGAAPSRRQHRMSSWLNCFNKSVVRYSFIVNLSIHRHVWLKRPQRFTRRTIAATQHTTTPIMQILHLVHILHLPATGLSPQALQNQPATHSPLLFSFSIRVEPTPPEASAVGLGAEL